MKRLEGIPVSPGVAIGRLYALEEGGLRVARRKIAADQVEAECARLDEALAASIGELERVHAEAEQHMGSEAANVFRFHIGMLHDRSMIEPMRALIADRLDAAEYAVFKTFKALAERFAAMPDSAFTTKTDDIDDLAERVIGHLTGQTGAAHDDLPDDAVVLASELTPSETVGFDRDKLAGLATKYGGKTSHTAIVARALGIPAVVGVSGLTDDIDPNDEVPRTVIVDGTSGVVIVDPDEATITDYLARREQQRTYALSLGELADLPAVTADGTAIQLLGNIELAEEINTVLTAGGEGIGLYRTEFLYLTRKTFPTEADHLEAYTKCLKLLGDDRPLVIRTLDLGADKYAHGHPAHSERNPFLGLRSIRYSLDQPEAFKTQLRAILRASAIGRVRVMFPLVTSVHELRHAKLILRDLMEEFLEEGVPFDRNLKVGMMVEVPSAALMAETFAREVDFFSIGTNDLVQYTLAVDRTNERVADLFSPTHPAVLRLIKDTVRGARRHHIPVSCCGTAAGDVDYAVLLIGLGLRTLSVTPTDIPNIKRIIRSITVGQCERIAKKAVAFDSAANVSAFVRDKARKIVPEAFAGRPGEN